LKKHGIAGLKMLGDPVQILAEMVRPTFVAPPGETFLVGDFAQIEARVTAWLAGETQLLEGFAKGEDVYCKFGTRAFNRVITKADIIERFISKGCVLGLGFGGGPGALARTMKKEQIVLPDDELEHFVKTYRGTYTRIVAYWKAVMSAIMLAMYSKNTITPIGPVSFMFDGTHLWCRLPSGRLMCYPFAKIVTDDWGDSVEYRRGNRSPKSGVMEWPTVRLWHGIVTENLAQAIAFDLLQGAIRRLRNWEIRLHTHDEIVVSVPTEGAAEKAITYRELMVQGESWSDGLPIDSEIEIHDRYYK